MTRPTPPAPAEVRRARVALSMLVEPGHRALWSSVATHGPVRVLEGLLAGGFEGINSELQRATEARRAWEDPYQAAERALAHAHRVGARVVVPEDDEWPRQLNDLRRLCTEGRGEFTRHAAPPLCLWVRGPRGWTRRSPGRWRW